MRLTSPKTVFFVNFHGRTVKLFWAPIGSMNFRKQTYCFPRQFEAVEFFDEKVAQKLAQGYRVANL